MFYQSRDDTRTIFFSTWQKMQNAQLLEPLEQQIANIIAQHPEYHSILDHPNRFRDQDYLPETGQTNPFLHMGMHIAILEQISLDQPPGIRNLYHRLLPQNTDAHSLDHRIMDCLAQMILSAQKHQRSPDFAAYFECVKNLNSP
jgi:hypothetical protein